MANKKIEKAPVKASAQPKQAAKPEPVKVVEEVKPSKIEESKAVIGGKVVKYNGQEYVVRGDDVWKKYGNGEKTVINKKTIEAVKSA